MTRPLRPGVRVGGASLPFWQQFAYEHLEGICAHCGSVHPAGSCLSSPTDASSSDSLVFGPWMAAVRRRRTPLPAAPPSSSPQRAAAASPEGWQTPKKVARRVRRAAVAGSGGAGSVVFSGEGNKEVRAGEIQGPSVAGHCASEEGLASVASSQVAVFSVKKGVVPVPSESSTVAELSLKQAYVNPINPFAQLGKDNSAGTPRTRKEANPGPLNRARPIETPAPRVVSKTVKEKGKIPTKSLVQSSLALSVSEVMKGPVTFQGGGPKICQTAETQGSAITIKGPQMMQAEDRSHDSVVALLKKAIQPKVTVEAMDSQDQCPVEGAIPASGLTDAEMSGVLVGSPLLNEDPYMEC